MLLLGTIAIWKYFEHGSVEGVIEKKLPSLSDDQLFKKFDASFKTISDREFWLYKFDEEYPRLFEFDEVEQLPVFRDCRPFLVYEELFSVCHPMLKIPLQNGYVGYLVQRKSDFNFKYELFVKPPDLSGTPIDIAFEELDLEGGDQQFADSLWKKVALISDEDQDGTYEIFTRKTRKNETVFETLSIQNDRISFIEDKRSSVARLFDGR